MSDIETPFEDEVSAAPPAEPCSYVGWGVLAFVLLVMFALTTYSSFSGKHRSKSQSEESPMSFVLQFEVSERRLLAGLPQPSGEGQAGPQQISEMLREPISDLAESSRTDPEASRFYAAMRTERGDPVATENLEPLRKSSKPEDRAFAEIYGSKSLTRSRAVELAKQLPSSPFEYRLAKVHALERAGDTSARTREFTGNKALGITAVMILGFIIFLGSAIAWAIIRIGLRSGKIKPLGMPLGEISLADSDRLAMRAAQFFGVFLALSFCAGYFVKGTAAYLVSGVAMILAVPVLSQFPIGGKRIRAGEAGMSLRSFGNNILWGIGGFFAELPITGFLMIVGLWVFRFLPAPSHPASQELANAKNLAAVLPVIFFGSITAPLWEEFVFRGLIFPGLTRVIGRVVPAAISTGFLFAMIHPQGAAAWMALAMVGSTGCALTYYTRSLVPTIVMHMLHNTTIFIFALAIMAQP